METKRVIDFNKQLVSAFPMRLLSEDAEDLSGAELASHRNDNP